MNFNVAVVGGAGHIGLPMSCFIQNKGIQTLIIDKNEEALKLIKQSTPPFTEKDFQSNLTNANKAGLKVSTDISEIKNYNIVIVTLGTSSKKEDKDLFEGVISEVLSEIKDESILLLRSTVEKGMVEKLEKESNKQSKNILIAYCPERLAEGFAFEEIELLPQIVGCKNEIEFKKVKSFFDLLEIESIYVNYSEAEFIKLFLNAYRYSQFSLVNYFSNIARNNSIDFKKILDLAKKGYPRLDGIPESGFVGGPCLIKDSKTFINSYGDHDGIIEKFHITNEEFINLIVLDISEKFVGKKIIQLGLTFKPNSDDLRDSQSLVLNNILKKLDYEVEIVEPNLEGYKNYKDIVSFSENVLITTFHDEFKDYNFDGKKVIVVGNK
jgi:UDP-N-acetyl-D-mannosaminuronic acid dehydrogenase|tara:strand:- start:664 stop:1806 length:1143 start_codon:yes stop_codon:yes gene_type:complete